MPDSSQSQAARSTILAAAATLLLSAIFVGGCGKSGDGQSHSGNNPMDDKQKLIVFHAGSLSVPFKELSELFEIRHPGVEVLAEPAGSRDTARKVSDLHRPCDVLGSADYKVIDNLLIPDHASFNIRFAANEMIIAHTERSKYADEITGENWTEILLREDVTFGRSDPDSDPCGYRTVMLFQLAEKHTARTGLADQLLSKHGSRYIRPKETDLLALLEIGEIDYLPIYRSVAAQHGLHFVVLPDEINLRATEHADIYATAKVEVTGKKPGELITRTGAPIVYGITIPDSAPNRDLALAYVELLLSPEGQALMERNGQLPIVPAIADDLEAVPESLRPYCKQP